VSVSFFQYSVKLRVQSCRELLICQKNACGVSFTKETRLAHGSPSKADSLSQNQARNQLGIPGGRRVFWEGPNVFKLP